MLQPRGEHVKALIKDGMAKLAISAGTKKYTYNATELSNLIGVSRPTLAKYIDYVDEVLKDVSGNKKIVKGEALIEFMREKIERIDKEKDKLKKDLDALRGHHAKIYETLYYRSVDVAPLVKRFVLDESKKTGKCILCNQAIDTAKLKEPVNKVVQLSASKKKAIATKSEK